MRKIILLLSLVVSTAVNLPAQDNSAPVLWQRYKVTDAGVSFVLPKMPTVDEVHNMCYVGASRYFAYAEDVIYEVNLLGRSVGKASDCFKKLQMEIDHPTIDQRIRVLRDSTGIAKRDVLALGGLEVYKFIKDDSTLSLIPYPNGRSRWVELTVFHRPGVKPDVDNIIRSLKFDSKEGIEIGKGADATIGDSKDASAKPPTNSDGVDSPLQFYFRRFARYTDEARTKEVTGAVKVRVTFQANGGISGVRALNELPHGLTESAVEAVKKIVFLPRRSNGIPVAETRVLEYKFTIY